MIEPDNDSAFHELVRQRMAAYQPPFDVDNWQRMRRKLRREWWRRVGWMLIGTVLLVSIAWYIFTLPPTPSDRLKPMAVSGKSTLVKPLLTIYIHAGNGIKGRSIARKPSGTKKGVTIWLAVPTAAFTA